MWQRLKSVWAKLGASEAPDDPSVNPGSTPGGSSTPKSAPAQKSGPLNRVKSLLNQLFHPTQPTFGEFDYLFRLAEQTIVYLRDDAKAGPERESIKELLDANKISIDPTDSQALASQLRDSPILQEHLSYRVNYTPSRWLVEREVSEIVNLRRLRGRPPEEKAVSREHPYDWMQDNAVTGLCFSGGGIRSATFNLGILQGLAQNTDGKEKPLLERVDYLSTVSGGEYIHEWLAAWIKRRGLDEVKQQLIPLPEANCPPFHPAPLRWLRRYSNYLTPRKGMFSTDTWVAIAIWLRNTFLNQLILVSALLALMIVPHLLVGHRAASGQTSGSNGLLNIVASLAPGCVSVASTGSGNCASPL
jgi:hypothetical protein